MNQNADSAYKTGSPTLDDPWYKKATDAYYAKLCDDVLPVLAETKWSQEAFETSSNKIRISLSAKENMLWHDVIEGILGINPDDVEDSFDKISDEERFITEKVVELQMQILYGFIDEIMKPMGLEDPSLVPIKTVKEHYCDRLLGKPEKFIREQFKITCDRLTIANARMAEVGEAIVLKKQLPTKEELKELALDQVILNKMLIACLVALMPDRYRNDKGEIVDSNLEYASEELMREILDAEKKLAGAIFVRGVIDSALSKIPPMLASKAIPERPFTARRLIALRHLAQNGFVRSDLLDSDAILTHPEVEAQVEKLERKKRPNDLYWGLEFERVIDYEVEKLPAGSMDSEDPYEVLRAAWQARKTGQEISQGKLVAAINSIGLEINSIVKEIMEDGVEEGHDIVHPESFGVIIDIIYFQALDHAFLKYKDEQEKGNDVGPLEVRLAYKLIRSVEAGYNRWRYQHFAQGELASLGIPSDQDLGGEISLPFSQGYPTQIVAAQVLMEMGVIDPEQRVTIHLNASNFTYVDLELAGIDLLLGAVLIQVSSFFGNITPGPRPTRIGFPSHSRKGLFSDVHTPPYGLPIKLSKPEEIPEIPDPEMDDSKFLQRWEGRGIVTGSHTFGEAIQILETGMPILDGLLKHIGAFSEYTQSGRDEEEGVLQNKPVLEWVSLMKSANTKFSKLLLADGDEEEMAEIENQRKKIIDNVNALLQKIEPIESLHFYWNIQGDNVDPINQEFFTDYILGIYYYATFVRNKAKRGTTFEHSAQVLDGLHLLRTALADRSFWEFIYAHEYEEALQVKDTDTLREYLIRFREITDEYYGNYEYWESYIGILLHHYNTHKEDQQKVDNALRNFQYVKENLGIDGLKKDGEA